MILPLYPSRRIFQKTAGFLRGHAAEGGTEKCLYRVKFSFRAGVKQTGTEYVQFHDYDYNISAST